MIEISPQYRKGVEELGYVKFTVAVGPDEVVRVIASRSGPFTEEELAKITPEQRERVESILDDLRNYGMSKFMEEV